MKNQKKLLKLMQENPDVDVLFLVCEDATSGEYYRESVDIDEPYIDTMCVYNEELISEDDFEEHISDDVFYDLSTKCTLSEMDDEAVSKMLYEEVRRIYLETKFEKYIIVNIG